MLFKLAYTLNLKNRYRFIKTTNNLYVCSYPILFINRLSDTYLHVFTSER